MGAVAAVVYPSTVWQSITDFIHRTRCFNSSASIAPRDPFPRTHRQSVLFINRSWLTWEGDSLYAPRSLLACCLCLGSSGRRSLSCGFAFPSAVAHQHRRTPQDISVRLLWVLLFLLFFSGSTAHTSSTNNSRSSAFTMRIIVNVLLLSDFLHE